MQETDERRGIVQQAIDTLPADSPDRLWLTFVTDNVATTPQSVLFMAIQTARDILGLDGPLELGPSEPVVTQVADDPAVMEAVHPAVAEDLPYVIRAEVIRSSEDPVDEVGGPALSEEGQDPPVTPAPVAEDAESAPDDVDEALPVVGDEAVADVQDVPDDSTEQLDPFPQPTTSQDHAAAAADSGEWTPTRTPFGFVPAEVDDAVFATEGNSRIALDLDFVSDEAEEAYAEEVGRDAEHAETLAGLEASWAGIETPLPYLPPMPPLVDSASSEVYGSEPAPR